MTPLIKLGVFILKKAQAPTLERNHLLLKQRISQGQIRCAGHAKWQNIRGTKQANDLAKGKLCSRYVLMVKRAIVSNGMQIDPKLNRALGDVLSEASRFNVPKATLERAIARATNMKIITTNCEIQGPGGCSLIARCETENVNLLRREVKRAIKKYDANLMPDSTLINMFKSQGFLRVATKTSDGRDVDESFAEDAAIMAGAEEVSLETCDAADEAKWLFKTDAETLQACKGELEKQGLKVLSTDLDLVAYREIQFSEDVIEKVAELTKVLRELDQVIDVYHNVAMSLE